MFNRLAGIFACCSLASGFLIPPNVKAASDRTHDLSFVSLDPKHQILELPCPKCAFLPKDRAVDIAEADNWVWIPGAANKLILNFTISPDGRELELNGRTIYPPEMLSNDSNTWAGMKIDQVAASTSREQLESGVFPAVPLAVSSFITGVREANNQDRSEVVALTWQLLELEGQAIRVDGVWIQLLTLEGELLILSAEPLHKEPAQNPPAVVPTHRPHHGVARPHGPPSNGCSLPEPICRLMRMLGGKVDDAKHSRIGSKLTGCAGRKGGRPHRLPTHIRPHFDHEARPHGPPRGPPFRYGRPSQHPHGRNGPHGHLHRHHGFLLSFMHGLMFTVKASLAGLALGLCFCVVARLTERFIVWSWIRTVRTGQTPASENMKRILTAFGYTEADWTLVDEEAAAPPPAYEAAPYHATLGEENSRNEKEQLSEKAEEKALLLPDQE